MPDPISDVNDKAASSTADVKPSAPASSPEPDANKDVSFADATVDDINKVIPLESAKKEDVKPESSTEPKGPEATPAGEIRKSNPTEEPKTQDEYGHLPFHEHKDFRKLIAERKQLREYEATAKPQLERLKIIDDWCAQNNITPEQVRNWMEIAALYNTNPVEAAKRLQPLTEQLGKYQGTVLPSDLQAAVESGEIKLEYAQRVARAEQQRQFDAQLAQQREAQTRTSTLATALNQWESNMMTKDLEYSKKQSLVNARFVALSAQKPWQTPEQAVALAQQAYDEVTSTISGFIPKPKSTKVLESNGSTVALQPEVTWDKVEDHLVAQHARG